MCIASHSINKTNDQQYHSGPTQSMSSLILELVLLLLVLRERIRNSLDLIRLTCQLVIPTRCRHLPRHRGDDDDDRDASIARHQTHRSNCGRDCALTDYYDRSDDRKAVVAPTMRTVGLEENGWSKNTKVSHVKLYKFIYQIEQNRSKETKPNQDLPKLFCV